MTFQFACIFQIKVQYIECDSKSIVVSELRHSQLLLFIIYSMQADISIASKIKENSEWPQRCGSGRLEL